MQQNKVIVFLLRKKSVDPYISKVHFYYYYHGGPLLVKKGKGKKNVTEHLDSKRQGDRTITDVLLD